jgi:hypothetical protein
MTANTIKGLTGCPARLVAQRKVVKGRLMPREPINQFDLRLLIRQSQDRMPQKRELKKRLSLVLSNSLGTSIPLSRLTLLQMLGHRRSRRRT